MEAQKDLVLDRKSSWIAGLDRVDARASLDGLIVGTIRHGR